jgi:hypothetical protein
VLTIFGYPAVAGFALQPYWLAYYGLLPLLDWRKREPIVAWRKPQSGR